MTATSQLPLFVSPAPYISPADVDVYALSVPARAFTGDFYFTHREGDCLWLAAGDVAGKGLPAAVVMGMIQEELEELITSCSRAGSDPAVAMSRLHAFVRPLLPKNRFVSAVIVALHDDGIVNVANAGHCPVLIRRRDGAIEEVASTGPVVGMLPDSRWRTVQRRLACGEALLLYSDGVIEARDREGEEFGGERLARSFSTSDGSARERAESIARAARNHGAPDDDFTLLVARR